LLDVTLSRQVPESSSTALGFRSDGMRLALAITDGGWEIGRRGTTVLEWDLASRHERTLRPRTLDERLTYGGALAYSPDGSRLAWIGAELGTAGRATIEVINAATGAAVRTIDQAEGMSHGDLTWSPDGRSLATFGSTIALGLYDATSGALLQRFHGSAAPARSVQFQKDGAELISIGRDSVLKTWELARVPSEPTAATVPARGSGSDALTDDGAHVAFVSSAAATDPWTVVVRDTADGRAVGRWWSRGSRCQATPLTFRRCSRPGARPSRSSTLRVPALRRAPGSWWPMWRPAGLGSSFAGPTIPRIGRRCVAMAWSWPWL
jgi:hypothetical protein